VWFEVTTLLIPGENDAILSFIPRQTGLLKTSAPRCHGFTAFHPDFKMLDKPRTPERRGGRGK
jgi:pyruvate formate lyase activating enzyme